MAYALVLRQQRIERVIKLLTEMAIKALDKEKESRK